MNLQELNPAEKEMGVISHMVQTLKMTTEIALEDIKRLGQIQSWLKQIKKSKTLSAKLKADITVVEGEVEKSLINYGGFATHIDDATKMMKEVSGVQND